VDQLRKKDYSRFDQKMQVAIEYANKLTKNPSQDFSEDLARLRKANWSEKAILEINLTISYFNMLNRIASGMNVALEEEQNYSEYMYGENGRMKQFENKRTT
jgi:alkylhydroperoxidase family enzyme